jgi:hypothetical protein
MVDSFLFNRRSSMLASVSSRVAVQAAVELRGAHD